MKIKNLEMVVSGDTVQLIVKCPREARDDIVYLLEHSQIEKENDYEVVIQTIRRAKSQTLNAKMWALTQKMANAKGVAKQEMHRANMMHYSDIKTFDGAPQLVQLSVDLTIEEITDKYGYVRLTDSPPYQAVRIDENGEEHKIWVRDYYLLRGTSEMDNVELWHYVENLIIECEAAGIETMPPSEMKMYQEMCENAERKQK